MNFKAREKISCKTSLFYLLEISKFPIGYRSRSDIIYYMNKIQDVSNVIKQICEEKGISADSVVTTIELALAAAYRKDFANRLQNISVEFNLASGVFKVYDIKEVIEDLPDEIVAQAMEKAKQKRKAALFVPDDLKKEKEEERQEAPAERKNLPVEEDEDSIKFNPRTQIILTAARQINQKIKIGEEIKTELLVPGDFGRMAAQTAKQVIIQRIREAERETIYRNFKEQEGKMLSGVVQRIEGSTVIADMGKTVGFLPLREQIPNEHYSIGQRIKVIILAANINSKGPEIILSRANKALVAEIFAIEVPEIASGAVEIKAIAREAGSRTKIAVSAVEDNIDPIGSCVGQRGTRVQTIINELNGEKIDIIVWDAEPKKFIAAALSPAKVQEIKIIDAENHLAQAVIKEEHQSLAIGKGGQNVRLAARLSGWKIDIMQAEREKKILPVDDKETVKAEKNEQEDDKEKSEIQESKEMAAEKKSKKIKKENPAENKKAEDKK